MTKTITKTTLAILALGLSAPAMAATDGSPGATSTGTLVVNLQVNAPAAETVQIYGLDNITIPAITRVAGQATAEFYSNMEYFCVVRSGPGPVNIAVTQAGGPSPSNGYSLNGAGGKILDRILVGFAEPTGSGAGSPFYGSTPWNPLLGSTPGCVAGSAFGVANSVEFRIPAIPADSTIADGALSQTFTLVVSIP